MSSKRLTHTHINDLLKPNFADLPDDIVMQFDKDHAIVKLCNCLKQKAPHVEWHVFRKEILEQLEKLIDTPLHALLTRSWRQYDKLTKVIHDQIDNESEDVAVIPLHAHHVRSNQTPQLTLNIENCDRTILPIQINLDLSLKNTVVKAQYGKVISIMSGLCSGEGSIRYGDITLLETTISEFHLSEVISIPD